MADIFNPEDNSEGNEVDISLNDLVGEGKKYSDPDEVAKAYAHLERHSRTLEAENADLRAKRDAEEARNKSPNNPEGNEQEPPQNRQDPPNSEAPNKNSSPEGNDDFRSRIKDEVRALNEEERAKGNMDTAARKMVEVFGTEEKARDAIRKRADELGVSFEWLKDSASRSPTAFFATMGITVNQDADRTTPSPNPEVRLRDTSSVKNFEYFDRIRKENPKLYFTAATQTEMMNEARKQGADFYKR